jgi:hypothetical protein
LLSWEVKKMKKMKKKIVEVFLWLFGASGAIVLYQKLDSEFAGAVNAGNWGFIGAWAVCAVLVLGCFGLAGKLHDSAAHQFSSVKEKPVKQANPEDLGTRGEP